MARRKKPEGETAEEAKYRHVLEHIANFSTRSEKTSWNRKLDSMVKLLAKLTNVEDKILELISTTKTPIMDEIDELRELMVQECIHPYEHLAFGENYVDCKFCYRRFSVVNNQ